MSFSTADPPGATLFLNESELAAPPSKAEYVLRKLREAIGEGRLVPGDPIHQEQVAAELRVSATPVREALRRLEAEGAIIYVANRGATVAELNAEDVQDLYALRSRIEGLATGLATKRWTGDLSKLFLLNDQLEQLAGAAETGDELARINRRFHFSIYRASTSRVLLSQIETLWTLFPIRANSGIWGDRDHASTFVGDHRVILQAMRDGDAEAADAAMASHVAMSASFRPSGGG